MQNRRKSSILCMELLNYIFRLGVLFAIYGFIWGLFELGLALIRSGRRKTITEDYVIKGIKYLFLVDVTYLFCLHQNEETVSLYNLMIAGLVLLTYFLGKFQNRKNQMAFFQVMNGNQNLKKTTFNMRGEITIITISIAFFALLIVYPNLAVNPISVWLDESIRGIEKTPVIGFIFKVIGFFFLLSMITKMVNGIFFLLSGKPFIEASSSFRSFSGNKKDDEFDDFEELK